MTQALLQEKYNHILDETLIKEIFEIGIFKSFKKDDIIIDINQTLQYIPLLLSGNIKILKEDKDGNELLIYFLEAGETCTMSLTCFDEMLDAIDSIAFMKMDERLYKYLINKAKLHNSKNIIVKHLDIAEDLHTSRVVISRLLKQLENQNKIKLSRNKIQVLG